MQMLSKILVVVVSLVLMSCDSGSRSSSSSTSSSSSASSSGTTQPKVLGVELDKKINSMMQRSGATAVSVAVAREGVIIYEQAYGFEDVNQSAPLTVNALMRIASATKPVTAAAIRRLEENGLLALSDRVFCDGSNSPCWLPEDLLPSTSDSRAKDITIEHLVAHQGGWYRDVSGDPFEKEVEIRDFLGLSGPPSQDDIIRYVMKSPLDYTPGAPVYTHDPYSNFGYLLLGKIIEQASQSSYIDYVHMAITDPLGIRPEDVKLGASRLMDHDPREPNYLSTDMCPSVFEVGQMALCAEEGADASNWVGDGGLIATTSALALFAQHYRLPSNYTSGYGVTGQALTSFPVAYGAHGGILPGSSAMVRQLPSGESYAILLNVGFYMEEELVDFDRISQLEPEFY